MKYKYLVMIPEVELVANLADEFSLASMLIASCALNEDRIKKGEKIPALVFVKEFELPGGFTWRSISQEELITILKKYAEVIE